MRRKGQIIRKGRQFGEIIDTGLAMSSSHFSFFVRRADNQRVGFAVSKKIKGAVRRNRARRRMKQLYRFHQHCLASDLHAVLMAKPGVERIKSNLLRDELLTLFRKVNSIKE